MPNLYSVITLSKILSKGINEIYGLLRSSHIPLEKGMITEDSLDLIKRTLGFKKEVEVKKKRVLV